MKRYNSGELMHADSIHFADSLKCYTLKDKRTVYGGGGIMPDYFIPLDTTVYTKYYRSLSRKNIILNAYMTYFDNNRRQLTSTYKDFDKFKSNFEVPAELIDTIIAEGKKMEVTPKDDTELSQTVRTIKKTLKGLAARDIWDMSEYFAIINDDSDTVNKAIELLQKK